MQLRADVASSSGTLAYPLTEITDYINRGIARVHGLLALSGMPYYRSSATFVTTNAQQQYYTTAAANVPAGTAVLPTDIFRVEALDVQVQSSRWLNAERFNWERRNDYQQSDWYWPVMTSLYDYMGSGATAAIFLMPPPSGAINVRLWYTPVAPQLANAADTWDSANRWDEYVIDFAARLLAERDENYELVARLDVSLAAMEAVIKAEGESRISGQAPKIRRHRYRRGGWPWGMPGGVP